MGCEDIESLPLMWYTKNIRYKTKPELSSYPTGMMHTAIATNLIITAATARVHIVTRSGTEDIIMTLMFM